MPIVFRKNGFNFYFYSNEGSPREPVHVHVQKGDSDARFWLMPVALADSDGFDARSLRDITAMVYDNAELIERAWHEHFG